MTFIGFIEDNNSVSFILFVCLNSRLVGKSKCYSLSFFNWGASFRYLVGHIACALEFYVKAALLKCDLSLIHI